MHSQSGIDRVTSHKASREHDGYRHGWPAGDVEEYGPAPLASLKWLIRYPYHGGALYRLADLAVGVY